MNIERIVPAIPKLDYDMVLAPLRASQIAATTDCKDRGGTLEGLTCKLPPPPPPAPSAPGTYANNYTWGNCTALVASMVQVPNSMGNAKYWVGGLVSNGWHVVGYPVVGDIGVTGAGWAGHVVVVTGVAVGIVVTEANYVGLGIVDQRVVGNSDFVWLQKTIDR